MPGFILLGPEIFTGFASVRLKTHEIGRPANALAQWCTFWCHQLGACVRNQGVNSRNIMCLLKNVVLGVQSPLEEPLDHEMVAVLLLLRRLFVSIGGK